MIWVRIWWDDGQYHMVRLEGEGEAKEARAKGYAVTFVPQPVWDAYNHHLDQCQVWYSLMSHMEGISHYKKENGEWP